MTPELIELSKKAAEVLGIEPKETYPSHFCFADKTSHSASTTWLAEDSERCADIAVDKIFDTTHTQDTVIVWYGDSPNTFGAGVYEVEVFLADHNNDRKQAWRVAVLKAVIEQEKKIYE